MPTSPHSHPAVAAVTARAPAKLILSGEHAVVHGHPALVAAINRYLTVTITAVDEPQLQTSFSGKTHLRELSSLNSLRQQLDQRHADFLRGQLTIKEILDRSVDVVFYTCALFFHERPGTCYHGFKLAFHSDFPLGSGMGGSAALIAATLSGLKKWTGSAMSQAEHYDWTRHCERLLHGRPSGIDPYSVVHGGLTRFVPGQPVALDLRPSPLDYVFTGRPTATTGECVAHVARHYPAADPIWNKFAATTHAMETALRQADHSAVQRSIQRNHQLLVELGVVPAPVATFIAEIEQSGGAAKVCGAGAVRGETAGVVWVCHAQDIDAISRRHGFTHGIVQLA